MGWYSRPKDQCLQSTEIWKELVVFLGESRPQYPKHRVEVLVV